MRSGSLVLAFAGGLALTAVVVVADHNYRTQQVAEMREDVTNILSFKLADIAEPITIDDKGSDSTIEALVEVRGCRVELARKLGEEGLVRLESGREIQIIWLDEVHHSGIEQDVESFTAPLSPTSVDSWLKLGKFPCYRVDAPLTW